MSGEAYDFVVIGAGIGGLVCATRLVQSGARVAICEAMPYPGGYMATFVRRGFRFPCGPLSFSSPGRVQAILSDLGLDHSLGFDRSHFRLLTPDIDLVISRPFTELAESLARLFPQETAGIGAYFAELRRLVAAMKGVESWEPGLLLGKARHRAEDLLSLEHPDYVDCLYRYGSLSSWEFAARFVSDQKLVRLLSQQEEGEGAMTALLAANMWDILCEKGIWYPEGGIQGIVDRITRRFVELGGDLKLSQPVRRILCPHDRISGVQLATGQVLESEVVVSNADYKRTLLELLDRAAVPPEFAGQVQEAEVTGTDLSVSVGAELPDQVLCALQAQHVLYHGLAGASPDWDAAVKGPEFFRAREIEICAWSQHDPGLAPPGKSVVILRCRAPYEHFARWKGSNRRLDAGYRHYKMGLARSLIAAAEDLIPGLSRKTECVDVATPLTFERYTANHQGAVAGWSWAAGRTVTPRPEILAVTPIEGLYSVGHWAFSMPFLGAVPTAMHSGDLVAQFLLDG
jgi:phytoene desaturase